MAAKVDGFVFSEAPAAPQKKAPMKTPRRKAKASKPKEKKAFATHAEQTLLAAVVKFGNNYQLAKLAGITPDILSRFARQERTLRLSHAFPAASTARTLHVFRTHST